MKHTIIRFLGCVKINHFCIQKNVQINGKKSVKFAEVAPVKETSPVLTSMCRPWSRRSRKGFLCLRSVLRQCWVADWQLSCRGVLRGRAHAPKSDVEDEVTGMTRSRSARVQRRVRTQCKIASDVCMDDNYQSLSRFIPPDRECIDSVSAHARVDK